MLCNVSIGLRGSKGRQLTSLVVLDVRERIKCESRGISEEEKRCDAKLDAIAGFLRNCVCTTYIR